METGLWADFANTTDRGGDLVSLYAAKEQITQSEAAKILSDKSDIRVKKEKISNGNGHDSNVVGIYDPFRDPRWGAPTEKYIYYKDGKPYFHVCRYEAAGPNGKRKKSFKQLTQRDDGVWLVGLKSAGITKPYPLFSDKTETDTILIVEGERTCISARKIAPCDVVTWFGGVANVKNANWSEIYGKSIIIWPDNDGPGHQAANDLKNILKEHCKEIRIVDTSKFELKEDAHDFVAKGRAWNDLTFQKHGGLDLSLNARGDPHTNENNVDIILSNSEKYSGQIWYDEFRQKRMLKDKPFTDHDYLKVLVHFQRDLGMHGATQNIVHGGVKFHSEQNKRNPVREYYENLDQKWDGTVRVKYFMNDVYGAAKTAYAQEVSRNFFLAMVARILNPGCKFDHMIILEGNQGIKKSTSLMELVGQEFYWDCGESMDSKDFVRGLKGKIIVELSELKSIFRSDVEMVKKTLSCCVDEFVEKYEIENKVQPRTCVFVGTTNDDEYLRDFTGNRRFWPIRTGKQDADIDYIRNNREQLFAEAVYRYKAGETYWEFKEEESKKEAIVEQENRLIHDEWMEPISDILASPAASSRGEITIFYILDKLNIPRERATRREQMRAGQCLRALGYKSTVKREGKQTKRIWTME